MKRISVCCSSEICVEIHCNTYSSDWFVVEQIFFWESVLPSWNNERFVHFFNISVGTRWNFHSIMYRKFHRFSYWNFSYTQARVFYNSFVFFFINGYNAEIVTCSCEFNPQNIVRYKKLFTIEKIYTQGTVQTSGIFSCNLKMVAVFENLAGKVIWVCFVRITLALHPAIFTVWA